jgi:hypothetical protein
LLIALQQFVVEAQVEVDADVYQKRKVHDAVKPPNDVFAATVQKCNL